MDIAKTILSWKDVSELADVLVTKMRFTGWLPDVIVGVARGGLIPGTLVSHRLDAEMTSMDLSLSKKDSLIGNCSSWIPELSKEGYKILIVDDINDTGKTFEWIREDWSSTLGIKRYRIESWPHDLIKFSALIHNYPSSQETDFFGMEINKEIEPNWVVFPWENQNNDRQ